MNSICIIGRLTADPELRQTSTGKNVISATVAVDRIGEGADFINIVAWEKTAEFIKNYFRKGMKIAIEGRLQSRSYEEKDGKKRTVHEVVVGRVEFCEKKTAEEKPAELEYVEVEEDLPF